MSNDIKPGDLVIKVRPTTCCGNPSNIGIPFKVAKLHYGNFTCRDCGAFHENIAAGNNYGDLGGEIECLIKIDPPENGDTLPTRKELEHTS